MDERPPSEQTAQSQTDRSRPAPDAGPPQAPAPSRFPLPQGYWVWPAISAILFGVIIGLMLSRPAPKINRPILTKADDPVTAELTPRRMRLGMENALAQLKRYHANIEIEVEKEWQTQTKAEGEIWVDGQNHVYLIDDAPRVYSDGQKSWSVYEYERMAVVTPDHTSVKYDERFALDEWLKWILRTGFDIRNTEIVNERNATRLWIEPVSDLPIHVWIDNETFLPIQVQMPWEGYSVRFLRWTNITLNPRTKPERFVMKTAGYRVIESSLRQVSTLKEASERSRLPIPLPAKPPEKIFANSETVILAYPNAQLTVWKPPLKTAFARLFGKISEKPLAFSRGGAELIWQDAEAAYVISAYAPDQALEVARLFGEITLPNESFMAWATQGIDLAEAVGLQRKHESEENLERHLPYLAAQTFIRVKMGPDALTGPNRVTLYHSARNEYRAIVEVSRGPYARLYASLFAERGKEIWVINAYDLR